MNLFKYLLEKFAVVFRFNLDNSIRGDHNSVIKAKGHVTVINNDRSRIQTIQHERTDSIYGSSAENDNERIRGNLQENPAILVKKLSEVSPYSKKHIEQSFVGNKIDWDLKYLSISETDSDLYRAVLKPVDKYVNLYVYCSINIIDFPQLKILSEGAGIRVRGEIESVNTCMVYLRNVKLTFK